MTTLNTELLIKLMKLTTSQTDGEALAALRAANKTLTAGGGDWELLLRGKLAPIDPFTSIAKPQPQPSSPQHAPPPPPPPPRRTRGLDKKEVKTITIWLAKLEFVRLDPTVQRQYDTLERDWKANKALTDTQFNWLRTAAQRI